MSSFIPILWLLIGLTLGVVATAFVMRLRERSACDKAKAEYEGERAMLIERVQSRDHSSIATWIWFVLGCGLLFVVMLVIAVLMNAH
jgi:hypothetical protein